MTASAFTAPHVTEFITVDVTKTMQLRDRIAARPEFRDVKLSPLVFAARALLLAVRRTPVINAQWDEPGQEVVLRHYVNLGIAAATGRGLVVPNIKDADRMTLPELATSIMALAATARSGETTPAGMTGGTITITNVGVFGVDTGTPIINPGESAILAIGAVRRQPWVISDDGKERIAPRWVTQLALSFDHRLVDGQQGSQVLADTAAVLREPGLAMLLPTQSPRWARLGGGLCNVVRVDSEEVDRRVARRLHTLRQERGITLTALAAQTGFSAAHLSRLEKGDRQPSIAALLHIARVYGVPVSTLVDDMDGGSYHVVRSAEAPAHAGEYTILSGPRAGLAVVRLQLSAGQSSDEARHPGDEWLHVLAGEVTLTLADERISLGEGDSVHFDSSLAHQLAAPRRHSASVLIASTSATAPMQHPIPPRAAGRRAPRSGSGNSAAAAG